MAKEKKETDEIEVGRVAHYFTKIGVGVVEITQGELKTGDKIHIKGNTTDFTQKVDSIQVEHEKVDKATKGQSVGLKIKGPAREHDKVFKVVK